LKALLIASLILGSLGTFTGFAMGSAVAVFLSTWICGALAVFAASKLRRTEYQSESDEKLKKVQKRLNYLEKRLTELHERLRYVKERLSDTKEKLKRTEKQCEELEAWKLARIAEEHKEQVEALSAEIVGDDAPEVEVEVKLVYPLLRLLGYEPGEMHLRVPVPMQEGSRRAVRQADWVVRTQASDEALLVVETKAPRQPLDEAVERQARSYAFRLEAPVYVTTNGKELRIFHRGVLRDSCVFSCEAHGLGENWEAIEEVLSRREVKALKDELS
jgi:hypothetical protein